MKSKMPEAARLKRMRYDLSKLLNLQQTSRSSWALVQIHNGKAIDRPDNQTNHHSTVVLNGPSIQNLKLCFYQNELATAKC